jgi:hypothetical protein
MICNHFYKISIHEKVQTPLFTRIASASNRRNAQGTPHAQFDGGVKNP